MGLHAGSFLIYIASIAIYYFFSFNYAKSPAGDERVKAFNTMCYAWMISELCNFVSQLLLIYIFIQIAKGQVFEGDVDRESQSLDINSTNIAATVD